MRKNNVFDVQKKLYNLPELGGGGGEVIWAMPERNRFFLCEVIFPYPLFFCFPPFLFLFFPLFSLFPLFIFSYDLVRPTQYLERTTASSITEQMLVIFVMIVGF